MGHRVHEVLDLDLPWLVLEEEGAVIGYACAVRWKSRAAYQHSVESTIYLAPELSGAGRGVALYSALMEQLKLLGVHCVLAGIAQPNEASVGLHEKLGFSKVAHLAEVGRKFDRWVDVGYWQRVLD
jgi:phosphinothricin acetyltransferase